MAAAMTMHSKNKIAAEEEEKKVDVQQPGEIDIEELSYAMLANCKGL